MLAGFPTDMFIVLMNISLASWHHYWLDVHHIGQLTALLIVCLPD
jgi:hypothetical protein